MPNETPVIALKVDVDTFVGTRDGVPRLLDLLDGLGIRATFYFSMGPDNSGKELKRIFTRQGYLGKLLRTRRYCPLCLKTVLHGTLLPPPLIGETLPKILKETEQRGHEPGIHCWDHVKWDDYLPWLPKPVTAMELGRASAQFEQIFGHRARSTAAPGWKVSADSLEIQDAMGLDYCSDSRGTTPFYPVIEGRRFRTLQIPTTLPTLDEILGIDGVTPETAGSRYLSLIRPGLNVHTIQAEMEGQSLISHFADLLAQLRDRGARFVTLAGAAAEFGPGAPAIPLVTGKLPGRDGRVAIQGSI